MPISRDIARKASGSFKGMRMYPDLLSDEGRAVMASILDRLQERADDESHALRVTAKLRDSADFFPTPAAVVQACDEMRQATKRTAHSQCAWCHGSGWELVQRGDAEGVKRCRCGGFPPLPDAAKSFDAPAKFSEIVALAERDGVR